MRVTFGLLAGIGLLMALLLPVTATAKEEFKLSDVQYIPLQPAFVANYGGPGRLKYLKTDITLMVKNLAEQQLVEGQLPLVRNSIILTLSRQNENNVTTSAGQERIRQQVLQAVNEALTREIGQPLVHEVLFTNFIYQN